LLEGGVTKARRKPDPLDAEAAKSVYHYNLDGTFTDPITGKTMVGHISHRPRKGRMTGYRRQYLGRYGAHYEHRLAHLQMVGVWPKGSIHHRDFNGLNNAWNNLEPSTPQRQAWETWMPPDHPTGHIGVRWRRDRKKWVAEIRTGEVRAYKEFLPHEKQEAIAFHEELVRQQRT
jgi:hypothetical protein